MTIEQMKKTSFPKANFENWQEEAVRTLKGKPYEQLITPTFEGIDLQPLYTAEYLQKTLNHSAVISHSKKQANWLIAQKTKANSASDFLHKAKEQLSLGNDMIVYKGTSSSWSWTANELEQLAEMLTYHPFHLSIKANDDQIMEVFDGMTELQLNELVGYLDGPVSAPTLNTVLTTSTIHYAGGTAVHELAYALLVLSKQAEKQTDLSKVAIQFEIDTNFFMEVAKLRAFRVLWKAFSSAYKQNENAISVFANTSMRSYSKLDPTVNLLRAGNATFSAVLGGADIISVVPHDELTGSSPTSERIARNVQLVIREETMVNKMIDPSAGSYYVESLTAELVHQAWDLFLKTLEMKQSDQEDYLLSLARDVQSSRTQAIAKRKASLIGTNVYANPTDAVVTTHSDDEIERLAVPFEQLRNYFSEQPLRTAVVMFGVLKDVKPRADFVQGFLQAGGLNPVMSPVFADAQAAWHWVKSNQMEYVVFAAKDEITNEILPQFLKVADLSTIIDVAGRHAVENQWREQGLNGSIFAGQDVIAKMQQLIDVKKNGGHENEA
ncbi:methylmalonyl-CoA mutase family protein [Paenisporosarcina quisquiliarum]|uniref:Methylmalonyl-CoA mutase family protein n=1 Tax=Paenisporosarcina quisquiliarum TaxID=365346 RepID=A0A9X3LJE6_9BACL|nr:methylmalonyl-CoA mutase family protein [Paenisporosarcina quisquiliarum]MCZ8537979.1 methylmalonyl-CoA mutase family protein [Paenisporosarcina quisquiliarum]